MSDLGGFKLLGVVVLLGLLARICLAILSWTWRAPPAKTPPMPPRRPSESLEEGDDDAAPASGIRLKAGSRAPERSA